MGHDSTMRRRRLLARFADFAVPWGVGLFVALVVLDEGRRDPSGVTLAALVIVVVQSVALRWRRRQPERATAVILATGFAFHALVPELVVPFAALFAVGSLAATRPPRVSLIGLAGLVALAAANFFTTTVEDSVFTMAIAVGAWALGEAARNRRVAIEEETQRAKGEEQARIARELHDVIAHSVSMIVVQAAAADDVFDERPDQAREALRSIERAGRDAMVELRRLLNAVRPTLEPDTEPQPGLDRLDELADSMSAGGVQVSVRREGAPAALPAGLDLSAYRIVQEALTNTLRHARATRAEVTLSYGAEALEVDVRDDGRATPGNGAAGGHGLVGMRERAALLGGTLDAGPQPGGGYRVHARLPLGSSP
jgi:signal transduction histidine kinase